MDIAKIRQDFPILNRKVNGHQLVYLDNAATSQKPRQVLDAMNNYYEISNANVHRGIHTLSVEASEAYEEARSRVAKFVGVKDPAEIIFVRNATEGINLVAYAWGRLAVDKDDEIVLTVAEHHSNLVPWQQVAVENGATIKYVPVDESGELDLKAFRSALSKRTKLVAFFHVSNVLGTINDVGKLTSIVKQNTKKAKVLVDGAQAVPHMSVDIGKIGCDFYVFTGHKMLGPTGIGVLWAKKETLLEMSPFMFGGEMIGSVSFEKTTWNSLPWKFEAGTPNIAGAIGLGAAVDYLSGLGMGNVRNHEVELTQYAMKRLSEIPHVIIYGPLDASARHSELDSESRFRNKFGMTKKRSFANAGNDISNRAGVVSFNIGDPSAGSGQAVHAHDVASILDEQGIAIRSGHHCAQPLMEFLGISSAARASFYIYNTKEEVDRLVEGVEKVKKTFKI